MSIKVIKKGEKKIEESPQMVINSLQAELKQIQQEFKRRLRTVEADLLGRLETLTEKVNEMK